MTSFIVPPPPPLTCDQAKLVVAWSYLRKYPSLLALTEATSAMSCKCIFVIVHRLHPNQLFGSCLLGYFTPPTCDCNLLLQIENLLFVLLYSWAYTLYLFAVHSMRALPNVKVVVPLIL